MPKTKPTRSIGAREKAADALIRAAIEESIDDYGIDTDAAIVFERIERLHAARIKGSAC